MPSAPAGPTGSREPWLALALREERHFSQIFGGYALELPGAHLVVNEKVPVPRFNWVQDTRCGPGRVTALIERTLEHYYQRALRPVFEVPADVPQPWLIRALGLAGFVPSGAAHRRHLLVWDGGFRRDVPASPAELQVEPLPEDEIDLLVDFLIESRYRTEVFRSLQTLMAHPNPGEVLVPYVGRLGRRPISFGLYHRQGPAAALFAVGTVPAVRDRGHATALVAEVLRREGPRAPSPLLLASQGPRPPRPLLALGFVPWASFDVYALSEEAARKGY